MQGSLDAVLAYPRFVRRHHRYTYAQYVGLASQRHQTRVPRRLDLCDGRRDRGSCERRITVHRRDGERWITRSAIVGGKVSVKSLGTELVVDTIYRNSSPDRAC